MPEPESGVERATPNAVGPREPLEWRLALRTVLFAVGLGVVFVAAAAVLVGREGALGAAIAVAVVAGSLLLSGAGMSLAAPFGPHALMAAVLGGYLLKLMIYALLIVLLRDVESIHGESLAITAAVLLIVALVRQVRVALRDQRLFWVSTDGSHRDAKRSADVVYPSGRDLAHAPEDLPSSGRTSA